MQEFTMMKLRDLLDCCLDQAWGFGFVFQLGIQLQNIENISDAANSNAKKMRDKSQVKKQAWNHSLSTVKKLPVYLLLTGVLIINRCTYN